MEDDVHKNCPPVCMNWPPSRGPNPHQATSVDYEPPIITRKILPCLRTRDVYEAERIVIQEETAALSRQALPPPPTKDAVRKRTKGKAKRHRFPRYSPLSLGNTKWRVIGPGGGLHVATLASLELPQADRLVHVEWSGSKRLQKRYFRAQQWGWATKAQELSVDIVYPIVKGVRILVKPLVVKRVFPDGRTLREEYQSPGYLLWTCAQEYVRIYAEHEEYGVWGHALDDLFFEKVLIDRHGIVDLWVGS